MLARDIAKLDADSTTLVYLQHELRPHYVGFWPDSVAIDWKLGQCGTVNVSAFVFHNLSGLSK